MVRPKKYLGQHFLKDPIVAAKIANSLTGFGNYSQVLEIGPGTGVLTKLLIEKPAWTLWMIEVDKESIHYLQQKYPDKTEQIIHQDFLNWNPRKVLPGQFAIIGNFPYNISSQIFFKILEIQTQVPEVVCMLQKEVAQRLVSPPGNRAYGILSVFLQAFYQLEYLFEVPPEYFYPIPKVDSAVIRLQSLGKPHLECNEQVFRSIVKRGFQNRRKTLRNALKAFNLPQEVRALKLLDLRAEQLAVEDYVTLTKTITPFWNP
jgi:16S rRNA (adenine1518-N6/adenine1519-N6)-dimethyltransferase